MVSSTDYLVIGSEVTESWLLSNLGTKIRKAMRLRKERESRVKIVSESHWLTYVDKRVHIASSHQGNKARRTPSESAVRKVNRAPRDQRDLAWGDAILRVLADGNGTMHSKAITDTIIDRQLRIEVGKTPHSTVSSWLSTTSRRRGSPVYKDQLKLGHYGLLRTAQNASVLGHPR